MDSLGVEANILFEILLQVDDFFINIDNMMHHPRRRVSKLLLITFEDPQQVLVMSHQIITSLRVQKDLELT